MTSQSRLEAMKLSGGLSTPLAARLGQAPRAMGCATSNQTLSTEAEDEQGRPSQSAGKQKGKTSAKLNSDNSEQKPKEQKSDQPESMKIRVIWRRVSIFGGGRRDSGKSKTNSDTELPGPSEYSIPVPQAKSPKI